MTLYQGTLFSIPQAPKAEEIDGFEFVNTDQYWVRPEPPEGLFDDIEFDADGEPSYTNEQIAYINRELDRWEQGYWFMNNGVKTYITGDHYFYLTCFVLENGDRPDYWDVSRRWFYFLEACKSEPMCDGIIRAKRRRRGATSEAIASLVKIAITQKKAFCGITSKTNKDAKETFLSMAKNAFMNLPIWAKPRVYDEDSQSELLFRKEKQRASGKKQRAMSKGGLYADELGLGSKIDFRPTAMNSYDSGRLTFGVFDEGGKYPADVPFNEYWAIVQQTLRIGGKRVGFAVLPSTCNKLTKGGRGYKMLWDDSDQGRGSKTGSGLYRYFEPAYEAYEPYIDKYGFSILTKPTNAQAKWMRMRYGATEMQCSMSAIEWLDYEESLKKDEGSRREFRRMYPRSEKDAFDYEDSNNIYDLNAIREQRDYLAEKDPPIKYRIGKFYRKEDDSIEWIDDVNGPWKILKFPDAGEINAYYDKFGKRYPTNAHKYVITVDPFKSTVTVGQGSKGAGGIWVKPNPLDPENSGMLIAVYWHRPKLRKHLHEQMIMAAEYYGAELCYESDYDDYIEFLMERNRLGYAKERPKNTIDPNRKRKVTQVREYGIKSADGFSYSTMIDRSIAYVIGYSHKIYFDEVLEQLEEYDENERTKFDLAVMFQLGTVVISDNIKPQKEVAKKRTTVLRTFNLHVGN